MNNMGPRTRRAVRGLKTRLRDGEREVCLGSAGDVVLRGLGERGWKGIRSCVVGVPVASPVHASIQPTPQQSSSASGSSTLKPELSLPDLLHSPTSPSTDADITKMVAKVGRWWYNRCYENSTSTSGSGVSSGSVFEDGEVLNECEVWRSSFKLLVGVARKPSLSGRRGASV